MPRKKNTTKSPARQSKKQSSSKEVPIKGYSGISEVSQDFIELLPELVGAINQRKYDEAERVGNELLDISPSEEVDRCLNDIITSATTIHDAEDEIRYQLEDLKTALSEQTPINTNLEITEVDGL